MNRGATILTRIGRHLARVFGFATTREVSTLTADVLSLSNAVERAERVAERNVPHQSPGSADWNPEFAAQFRAFLETDAGKAMLARMEAAKNVFAMENASDQTNTIHAAGQTIGWAACVTWIISLSRVSRAEDTTHQDEVPTPGESDILDQLTP